MTTRACVCGAALGHRQRTCSDCRRAAATERSRRWRAARYVPPAPREVRVCSIEDCPTRAHARGWCTKHWSRWRSTGDPLGVRQNGRPLIGINPGYDAAHRRVSRTQGPAKNHACVDCEQQAAEWSYDGGDPDALITEPDIRCEHPGLRYSLNAAYYLPRCVSCHRIKDLTTITPATNLKRA